MYREMLVDAFMFFNEFDVLEMRLKTLWDRVDLFVLVESSETHTGKPKPLHFKENQERYSRYLSKIRYIEAPVCTNTRGLWDLEKHQRDCIKLGLDGVPDDATIMISDVDEIPDPVQIPQGAGTVGLHMTMFEYSFDYMFTGEPWIGTVVTDVKELKRQGPNYFRYNRWRFPIITQAGWHLSSFGDAEHLQNKIKNYAHANDEKHQGQTSDDFQRFVEEGIHHDGVSKLVKGTRPSIFSLQ
jgi:beta-1,4-mannosyl-glycoprotein beta-1,4-N-acetylglucosaminyltransferase